MTTALVKQPTPQDWGMIQTIAASAYESRKLGIVKVQEAEIKLLTAYEQGFPLTSAFQIVYVINGVPSLSPKAIWAKIITHPQFTGLKEERLTAGKDQFHGFRLTLSRKNGVTATRQFTLDDAKRAGLADKDNWKHYPENMCFWRALGHVEDIVFPDVTLGMNRADELGAAITPDGDVIEGSWQRVESAQAEQPAPSLQTLIDTYGVPAILEVNNDTVPTSAADVAAVADKLAKRQAELDNITLDNVQELDPEG